MGMGMKEFVDTENKKATLANQVATAAATVANNAEMRRLQQRGQDMSAETARLGRVSAERIAAMPARSAPEDDNKHPPIAVLDDASGKVKYVARSDAIGKTPATMGESLSPKELQKREALYPKAATAVKQTEQSLDELITDLNSLANHKGLASITGIAAGRIPGITKEGRAAEALYDKIMARGGFSELTNLRASSPSGGALGSVSNTENQFLREAFAEIKRTQDAKDVKAALLRAATKVKNSKTNIKDAFEMTYEYRQGKESSAPSTPAGIDPEDWKHLTPEERALWKK
jgi:hypothetical protein